MSQLAAGQPAPDFSAPSPTGSIVLKDLIAQAEKGVIVYFYPQAGTPGCTTQACDFRDNLNSLKSAGYLVVGVSPDQVDKLQQFLEKEGLNFPVVSDPNHSIMDQWGVWGEKKNYGRTYEGVIRSTFVVGTDGLIVLAQYNVKATGHVARLRKELQIDA